ncbi:hypothetical protein V8Z77_09400 [Stutzerimonas stutzeri]|uniref:hypothetical protein n=1 Tax=Stutzerimonas stutzeri TaxID=316 RepID=UPI0031D45D43
MIEIITGADACGMLPAGTLDGRASQIAGSNGMTGRRRFFASECSCRDSRNPMAC